MWLGNTKRIIKYLPITESRLIFDNHDTLYQAILGDRFGAGDQTNRTEGEQCTWCHVGNSPDPSCDGSANMLRIYLINLFGFGWKTDNQHMEIRNSTIQVQNNDSVNGTGCEKCHSGATIHNIQSDNYNTQGELGYDHIGDNWDCNGRHAYWNASSTPMLEAIIPDINSITPGKLTTGVDTEVTITVTSFLSGDGNYTLIVSLDGTNLTPTSVTDYEIIVNVPGLTAGVHSIQVIKTGDMTDKLSKLSPLIVVPNRSCNSTVDQWRETGIKFGTRPDTLFENHGIFIDNATKTVENTTSIKTDIVFQRESKILADK